MDKFLFGVLLTTISLLGVEIKTYGCGVTKIGFLAKLNAAYEIKTSNKVSSVGRGGCPKGILLVGANKIDVAAGCRTPIGLEGEEHVKAHHVAWGALVAIVNSSNPISNITSQQFKDILKGKIKNWKELGGKNKPIQVYSRIGKTSGVGYSIRMALFNDRDASFTKDAKIKGSSGTIRKAVVRGENIFAVDDFVTSSKNKKIKMLSIDGVKPTKQNIISGKYPYYKPLYLYTHGKISNKSKKFLDFALSKEGQMIISDNNVVNLEEGKNLKIKY